MFVEDPDAFDDEDGGDPGSDPVDPDAVPVLEVDPTGTFSCSLLAPVVLLEIIASSSLSTFSIAIATTKDPAGALAAPLSTLLLLIVRGR